MILVSRCRENVDHELKFPLQHVYGLNIPYMVKLLLLNIAVYWHTFPKYFFFFF